MTPQERQRVERLFERLSQLENSPREREAEKLIAEGLRAVPNAPYALIQTVLVQEEALARANERIRQLEGGEEPAESEGVGFLNTLRGALAGQATAPTRRSSVPLTRGRDAPMGVPPALERELQSRNAPDTQIGRGGSFLGQAAAIATGVVVGSLAVDMLRGQSGSAAANSQQAGAQDVQAQQASHLDGGDDGEDGDYDTADFDDGDGFDIDFG